MTDLNQQSTEKDGNAKAGEKTPSLIHSTEGNDSDEPMTTYPSRKVMLRSERGDDIHITEVVQEFRNQQFPTNFSVIQRTETYFGPELLLAADEENYRLTAPGPDTQLLLWSERVNDREYREQWLRTAEVRAEIRETPQYDICDQCGNPIRSQEHERLALIGSCPDGS